MRDFILEQTVARVMQRDRVALQRDADARAGPVVDLGAQFAEHAFHGLEIDIAADGVFEQCVQHFAMMMIHETPSCR